MLFGLICTTVLPFLVFEVLKYWKFTTRAIKAGSAARHVKLRTSRTIYPLGWFFFHDGKAGQKSLTRASLRETVVCANADQSKELTSKMVLI